MGLWKIRQVGNIRGFADRNRKHGALFRQHLRHLAHGRARMSVGIGAKQAEQENGRHFRLVVRALQSRVGGAQQVPAVVTRPNPVHEDALLLRQLSVQSFPSAGDLQTHDSEGIDIALDGELAVDCSLGRHVTLRPGRDGGGHDFEMVLCPREPEVAQLRIPHTVQHYVAGLDVAVDHLLGPSLVQIVQSRSQSANDPEPPRPGQHRLVPIGIRLRVREQGSIQTPVGHELVDEQQLALVLAPAQQLHDVPVPNLRDGDDLRHEFAFPLTGVVVQFLDGQRAAIGRALSSVHGSEAPLAQLRVLAESVGGGVEFFESVLARLIELERQAAHRRSAHIRSPASDPSANPPNHERAQPHRGGDGDGHQNGMIFGRGWPPLRRRLARDLIWLPIVPAGGEGPLHHYVLALGPAIRCSEADPDQTSARLVVENFIEIEVVVGQSCFIWSRVRLADSDFETKGRSVVIYPGANVFLRII
ncbi:hypothetical protein Mapa_017387 [Marchantia paleacea]|nr:hypothetical protein Mapa_017387 [Marchantia paleacea]